VIDPHVHLRDWEQSEKETIRHAFELAWRIGIAGVFEMPNTDPPLTSRAAVERRIADADRAKEKLSIPIFHGIYAGITADPDQITHIVGVHREMFPRVVGFKLFAGHSTGNMGVVTRDDQWVVWKTLAEADYRGVVTVHAETEALLRPELWDPARPISHGAARPVEAEIHSVNQQIELADAAGFRGSLHIAHVTSTRVLDIIAAERGRRSFAVRGGVTPHHALLDETVAEESAIPEWKVNPPLRSAVEQRALLERVRQGAIDWIESDHAPHTPGDKRAGASGIPGIPAFRLLAEEIAADLPPAEVRRLIHEAVLEAFQIPAADIPDNPNAWRPWSYTGAAQEYPWDPYRYVFLRNRSDSG
jgi:dihydroorotase